jgi:haloalkane dehalogenase
MGDLAAIDFRPDPTLYPFTSRWFDSSAGRMHYLDEGPRAGPAILFCHGNPTWSFLYRHLIQGLRDQFRCVAADMIGFGLSARPGEFGYTVAEQIDVLGQLVDHLGLDGYVLMGQDWGGPVSLGVAVPRADRVRGVVLGNTWFWPTDALGNAFSAGMSSGVMQRRIIERNWFVTRLMPVFGHGNYTPAEFNHYTAVQPDPAARRGVATLPRQIRAAKPLLADLERAVPATLGDKPALIVWGHKDKGFRRRATLTRILAAFPDHELLDLPQAGHFFQEEEPDQVVAAIRRRYS